jgi:gas vesicle protein
MENDILKGIVEVEKEIRQHLTIEQKNVQEWLEEVKKEAEREVLANKSDVQENLSRVVDEARIRAERITGEERAYAEKLEGLGEDVLKKIIVRHLSRILPGT